MAMRPDIDEVLTMCPPPGLVLIRGEEGVHSVDDSAEADTDHPFPVGKGEVGDASYRPAPALLTSTWTAPRRATTSSARALSR